MRIDEPNRHEFAFSTMFSPPHTATKPTAVTAVLMARPEVLAPAVYARILAHTSPFGAMAIGFQEFFVWGLVRIH